VADFEFLISEDRVTAKRIMERIIAEREARPIGERIFDSRLGEWYTWDGNNWVPDWKVV